MKNNFERYKKILGRLAYISLGCDILIAIFTLIAKFQNALFVVEWMLTLIVIMTFIIGALLIMEKYILSRIRKKNDNIATNGKDLYFLKYKTF
jgi:hypothetical protein